MLSKIERIDVGSERIMRLLESGTLTLISLPNPSLDPYHSTDTYLINYVGRHTQAVLMHTPAQDRLIVMVQCYTISGNLSDLDELLDECTKIIWGVAKLPAGGGA